MSQLPIDLDAEAIQYDGHWYTREELARRIKQMLDSGDFAVGRPSQALEQLTNVMSTLRTLAFRLPPEMADQLNQVAARHGRTLGSLIRESLTVHLNLKGINLMEGSVATPAVPPAQAERPPQARKHGEPEGPLIPRTALATQGTHPTPPGGIPLSALPADMRAPQSVRDQVIAGPGAIKAAQPERSPSVVVDKAIVAEEASIDDAVSAVSLGGPKKKPPSDEDAIERGWFGR